MKTVARCPSDKSSVAGTRTVPLREESGDRDTDRKKETRTTDTHRNGTFENRSRRWGFICHECSPKLPKFRRFSLYLLMFIIHSISPILSFHVFSQTVEIVESIFLLTNPFLRLIWFLSTVMPLRLSSSLISRYPSGLPGWGCWHAHSTALTTDTINTNFSFFLSLLFLFLSRGSNSNFVTIALVFAANCASCPLFSVGSQSQFKTIILPYKMLEIKFTFILVYRICCAGYASAFSFCMILYNRAHTLVL